MKIIIFDKRNFLTILVAIATIQNMIFIKIYDENLVFALFHKL